MVGVVFNHDHGYMQDRENRGCPAKKQRDASTNRSHIFNNLFAGSMKFHPQSDWHSLSQQLG